MKRAFINSTSNVNGTTDDCVRQFYFLFYMLKFTTLNLFIRDNFTFICNGYDGCIADITKYFHSSIQSINSTNKNIIF